MNDIIPLVDSFKRNNFYEQSYNDDNFGFDDSYESESEQK